MIYDAPSENEKKIATKFFQIFIPTEIKQMNRS